MHKEDEGGSKSLSKSQIFGGKTRIFFVSSDVPTREDSTLQKTFRPLSRSTVLHCNGPIKEKNNLPTDEEKGVGQWTSPFTLNKLECFKQAGQGFLNTLAWDKKLLIKKKEGKDNWDPFPREGYGHKSTFLS